MEENDISYKIISAAMEIHKALGPGLLESAYEATLLYELRELGLKVKSQLPMPLVYKGVKQEGGYRIDLLVENKVIAEIKSIENLMPVHFAQTLTYLRLAAKKLALLINFNSKLLKMEYTGWSIIFNPMLYFGFHTKPTKPWHSLRNLSALCEKKLFGFHAKRAMSLHTLREKATHNFMKILKYYEQNI